MMLKVEMLQFLFGLIFLETARGQVVYPYQPYQPYQPLQPLIAPNVIGTQRPTVNQIMVGAFTTLTQQPQLTAEAPVSSSLIRTPQTTMLADSGYPNDRRKLIASLAQQGLTPPLLDIVMMTHGHADHLGNLGSFDSGSIFLSPGAFFKYNTLCFTPLSRSPPGTAFRIDNWITVMSTGGGDSYNAISAIVQNADVFDAQNQLAFTGTVAMIGDLLIQASDFNGTFTTAGSPTPAVKLQSLAALFCPGGANVGFVIPGHSTGFQITQAMRNSLNCAGVTYQPTNMTMTPNWRQNKVAFNCNMITYV